MSMMPSVSTTSLYPPPGSPPRDNAANAAATHLTIPAPGPAPAGPQSGDAAYSAFPENSAEVGSFVSTQEKSGLSFFDFLDLINPLQHIPGVSAIYRDITGDTIRPEIAVMGAGLIGGPIGLLAGATKAVIEQINGESLGESVMALMGPGQQAAEPTTAMAQSTPDPVDAMAQAMTGGAPVAAASSKPNAPPSPGAVAHSPELAPSPPLTLNQGQGDRLSAFIAASQRKQSGAASTDLPAPARDTAKPVAGFKIPSALNEIDRPRADNPVKPAAATTQSNPTAVPSLMSDALSKYEQMMRARLGAPRQDS